MTCRRCGNEIEDPRRVFYEITGYEAPKRLAGGTNAVHLRQRTGVVVHEECMRDMKREVRTGPMPEPMF